MLSRLRSAAPHLSSAFSSQTNRVFRNTPTETTYYCFLSANAFSSKVATASADLFPSSNQISDKPEVKVNLNAMFWSKPCSLALAKDSPLRIEDPDFSKIKRFIFKLLLFYSKQSKSIRGANVVYSRILSQVDKPPIYDVFNLEKTFKTTFSLLVLHMWLVLRRLKEEGKEGTEFGQYLYEIYNHDLELRVAKAGVNLLLTKWMKDLEKIFYGNIVAYDAATTQEAKHEDLANVLWRNIFSEDGSDSMRDAASTSVQAMARYTRRELTCLSMTEKEAMYSGNFLFTPLTSPTQHTGKKILPSLENESMLLCAWAADGSSCLYVDRKSISLTSGKTLRKR